MVLVNDPRMSAWMIADTLGVMKSIMHQIVEEELEMWKICDEMVQTQPSKWD